MAGRWAIWVALGLLAWTALLRLPFWRDVSSDEMFFAIVGREWLRGGLPYVANFDVKPPGLFALFAAAQAAGGGSLISIKLMECLAVGASAFGLFLIATRYFGIAAGVFCGLVYPFYSLFLSGIEVPTEILLEPFEVFGIWLVLLRRLRGVAVAGVLFGAAVMVRQTAAIEALAVALAVGWSGRVVRAAMFLAGVAVLPVAFALYFWGAGHFDAFWAAAVVSAAGRLGGDNISFISGLGRFVPSLKPIIGLVAMALLLGAHRNLVRGTRLAWPVLIISCWLMGSVGAVIATRSMYDDYFLTLVPALLILSGVFLFHARGRLGNWAWLAVVVVVGAPVIYGGPGLFQASSDIAAEQLVARRLEAAGLAGGQRLLVLDRGLFVYLATGALPAAAVFYPQHLLCDFPGVGADPLAAALRERPDFIVLTGRSRRMVCERADRLAELDRAVRAGYAPVGAVMGRGESFELYRRL